MLTKVAIDTGLAMTMLGKLPQPSRACKLWKCHKEKGPLVLIVHLLCLHLSHSDSIRQPGRHELGIGTHQLIKEIMG